MGIYKRGRPKKWNPFEGKGSKPPKEPGEYRIRDKEGKLKYIGETNDLLRRSKEHTKKGKLAELGGGTFEWMQASASSDSSSRREHERRSIKKHKPVLNKSIGGEGRPAGITRPVDVVDVPLTRGHGCLDTVLAVIKWVIIVIAVGLVLLLLL